LDGDRQKNSEQTAQAIERLCRLGDENKFWAGCGAVLARLHGVHEGLKTLVKELEWRTKDAN
jgi:hypothetical protein